MPSCFFLFFVFLFSAKSLLAATKNRQTGRNFTKNILPLDNRMISCIQECKRTNLILAVHVMRIPIGYIDDIAYCFLLLLTSFFLLFLRPMSPEIYYSYSVTSFSIFGSKVLFFLGKPQIELTNNSFDTIQWHETFLVI